MFSSRFLWQVWLAVAGLVLISTLTFGILTSSQLQSYVLHNIETSLNNQAQLLGILIKPHIGDYTQVTWGELEQFGRERGIRMTLVGTAGEVIFDNQESAALMDNHGTRPEILQALGTGVGISQRYSQTLGISMLYLAVPILEKEHLMGFVRVSVSLSAVDEQLGELRRDIFLAGLAIAGIFLILSYFLALRFYRPILEMTSASVRLAQGEYDVRLQLNRHDELGQLANALNQLAESAANRIDALTHSRNQLVSVLSGLKEGVIAVDMEQRILHINHSAFDILGLYEKNKPQGHFLWEWVRIPELCQAVDKGIQEKVEIHQQIEFQSRVLELSVVLLIKDGNSNSATTSVNNIAGAIVVFSDITEVVRLEKVRTDFVANASHELKTPIAAIKGYVETIEDDKEMASDIRRKFISRIKDHAARLEDIVLDLLHLSRVDGLTPELKMERIDLLSTLKQIFKSKIDEAEALGIDFNLDLPECPILIHGDNIALWQLVTNLIDNAFKYINKKGEVTIKVSKEGAFALIEVKDNGIGIPLVEQERIFERFYRVDSSRSRGQGGTGLGLAIVKHIAQAHKGFVKLESVPGRGSSFVIGLPLDE